VALHAASIFAKDNEASIIQIVLSTAHPAKFSEAVTKALQASPSFNFEEQVLPEEFKGLLALPRRVIEVQRPDKELVKQVIEQVMAKDEKKLGTETL
jgi:threonine synthase